MNQIMALQGLAAGATPIDAPLGARLGQDAALALELRPLPACAEFAPAWSALARRALEPNLFFEPEFALAAAQHLVAFRDASVILVWQGAEQGPQRRLVGLLPCFPRNRLFVSDQLVGFSDRRVSNGAPLLDAGLAEAVIDAMLTPRGARPYGGRGLTLRAIDPNGPLVPLMLRVAERRGLSATLRPRPAHRGDAGTEAQPEDLLRRSLARRGDLRLVEARSRGAVRDAVELMLALDASGPRARRGEAILQDTREVGFLRAVTRSLALARRCRVGLLMLDDKPLAAAVLLGRAKRELVYAVAEDEAHAAISPQRLLLAMMRKGSGFAAGVDSSLAGASDLALSPRAPLQPRDLAARARAALGFGRG